MYAIYDTQGNLYKKGFPSKKAALTQLISMNAFTYNIKEY